jgi:hypothetical protein
VYNDRVSAGSGSSDVAGVLLTGLWPIALFLPLVVVLRVVTSRLERDARRRRLGTLEERLERAGSEMRRARELVDGVEAELTARQAAIDRLRTQAADWERLASFRQTEAAAVASLVRQEVSRGGRRGLWQGAAVNGVFFIAGYAAQFVR